MFYAYVIEPMDLKVQAGTQTTLSPLSCSAAHISRETGFPCGLTIIDRKAYVGNSTNLPSLTQYASGYVDILDEPDNDIMKSGGFSLPGELMLIRNRTIQKSPRSRGGVPQIFVGRLEAGMILLVYSTDPIEHVSKAMLAYGVTSAMLLASGDDVYFSNPINAIQHGVRPVISLNVSRYMEVTRPIIVIDAACGGTNHGYTVPRRSSLGDIYEKDINLNVAKEMKTYLKEHYYGTFILTRDSDEFVTQKNRAALVSGLSADFVYTCRCGKGDGKARGFSVSYYDPCERTTAVKFLTSLSQTMRGSGVPTCLYTPHKMLASSGYAAPTVEVELARMDNALDLAAITSKATLKLIAGAQAEALAGTLGLTKKLSSDPDVPRKPLPTFGVSIGGFILKSAADSTCERLRNLGYDARVIEERK